VFIYLLEHPFFFGEKNRRIIQASCAASGYKGIYIGEGVADLPPELRCSAVYCEGSFKGDWILINYLDNKVLTIDVIYIGTSLYKDNVISKSVPLANAIRIHSLQRGLQAPVLALAKGRNHQPYGVVDIANAIVYQMGETATDPAGSVLRVAYVSPDAPVLKTASLPEGQSSVLLAAAGQTTGEIEPSIASASTLIKVASGGPFGFEKGMTREQIIQLVGKEAVSQQDKAPSYILALKTAPKPHPAFEEYILSISPKSGLLKLSAIGKTIDCDAYGTDLKTAFANIVSGVSKKYGPPEKTLDASTTDLFREPQKWMMALYDKDRILESFWKFEPTVNNIKVMMVRANATSSDKGYVVFAVEFAGFEEYVDSQKAKEDEVF